MSPKSYVSAFCTPQVPFSFEFESEQPNGNLATLLSPNCHSAVHMQTQTQTEPEVFRKHIC